MMKLLIMQPLPLTCYLIPLRSKYSPQNPVLKYSQSVLLLECGRLSVTPLQNIWLHYDFVYVNLYIPR
jgi:hypothetical protein